MMKNFYIFFAAFLLANLSFDAPSADCSWCNPVPCFQGSKCPGSSQSTCVCIFPPGKTIGTCQQITLPQK